MWKRVNNRLVRLSDDQQRGNDIDAFVKSRNWSHAEWDFQNRQTTRELRERLALRADKRWTVDLVQCLPYCHFVIEFTDTNYSMNVSACADDHGTCHLVQDGWKVPPKDFGYTGSLHRFKGIHGLLHEIEVVYAKIKSIS